MLELLGGHHLLVLLYVVEVVLIQRRRQTHLHRRNLLPTHLLYIQLLLNIHGLLLMVHRQLKRLRDRVRRPGRRPFNFLRRAAVILQLLVHGGRKMHVIELVSANVHFVNGVTGICQELRG